MNETNDNLDDELLSAYVDGELTDAERAAVEARLEGDAAARELVAELRSLSGSLRALPRESLAEDLRGAVLKQIGDAPVSLPPVKLSMVHRLLWPAIAIAAALL
jgi:anti-sigma factor RsiW